MFLKNIALSFLFMFALPAFAQLTSEQQAAKEKGIILFNQYKVADAELRVAAEAGDKDAQYYLAEYLRKKNRYMSAESIKWYQAAAEQNDPYSMVRLGRSGDDICAIMEKCESGNSITLKWFSAMADLIGPKADQGDPESLYLLYKLSGDWEYLKKSAEANYALAQYKLALFINEGQYEKFRNDESRLRRVEELMQASSENGYPKAMLYHIQYLYADGDVKSAYDWYEKAAATGYVSAVYGLGMYLSHEMDDYKFDLDIVRGYALTSIVAKLDGGGSTGQYAQQDLPKIEKKMTADQIKAAKKYAAEWEATHPPLSFFPDKLSEF